MSRFLTEVIKKYVIVSLMLVTVGCNREDLGGIGPYRIALAPNDIYTI